MASRETKTILFTVAIVFFVASYFLYSYYNELFKFDFLAVSQIYVEVDGGKEDPETHEWRGSWWVILATSSTKESYLAYEFDKEETEKPYADNTVGDKTLVPEATIKITVTALKPYWKISLKRRTYEVLPKTYGTYINRFWAWIYGKTGDYIEPLRVDVWETTGYWEHHAPFQVVVEKIGDYYWKSEPITVDLVGSAASKAITITSPKGEKLKIKLIGQLETGYGPPLWEDLMIFNLDPNYAFKGSERIRNIINWNSSHDLTYCNYWFGGGKVYTLKTTAGEVIVRKWEDGTPAHYYRDPVYPYPPHPVPDYAFPGSYRADTLTDFIVKPIRPKDAFTDIPDAKPYGKSLVRYLVEDCDAEKVDLDYYKADYELSETELKIYQPIDAVSWLYTLWISTELADTIVYQPIAANGKIVGIKWLSTDTNFAEIGGKDIALVTVKQLASEASKVIVEASTSTNLLKLTPESDSVILEPNEEHTFVFEAENLGAKTEVNGEVTFRVYNDLGTKTDEAKLSFKLLPTGIGDTILNVYTVDAETKEKVSGIYVTIQYGSQTDAKATVNGVATFNLGSYQGTVQITSSETAKYKSVSISTTVQSGPNTVVLELGKIEEPEPPWWVEYWWILIIIFSSIACILAVVAIARR